MGDALPLGGHRVKVRYVDVILVDEGPEGCRFTVPEDRVRGFGQPWPMQIELESGTVVYAWSGPHYRSQDGSVTVTVLGAHDTGRA